MVGCAVDDGVHLVLLQQFSKIGKTQGILGVLGSHSSTADESHARTVVGTWQFGRLFCGSKLLLDEPERKSGGCKRFGTAAHERTTGDLDGFQIVDDFGFAVALG